MIPESFIQELLQRIDIVELIDGYVPLKKAGANYAACCPFHSEKTPSFTVSPSKQFYHCFGCGAHGTAIGFLMEYSGLGFVETVKDLAARVSLQVPEENRGQRDRQPRIAQLTDLMDRAARYYYEQMKGSERAKAYLKKRGLSGEVVQRFRIGYAPDGWQNLEAVFGDHYHSPEMQSAGLVIRNDQGRLYDRFRDRVMFPIINQKGEVIAFGGRILDQGEPKYLNSPETPLFEKGHELFGLPQARQALRETDTAIVVEGYMDVVALSQHGIGNVVATLGTATTASHVQKLLRQVDRIVYCFDGDAAGRKAAWRGLENSLEALADNKQIGFVFLPPEHDPDTFVREQGKEAFQSKVAQALPLSDFLLKELATRSDLTTAEGKAQLVYNAKPLITRLTTPFLRLQLVKRLAEASGFSQTEVERLCELKTIAPPAPARAPRSALSLTKRLLPPLLQCPALASQLPLMALEGSDPATTTLRHLVEKLQNGQHMGNVARFVELFRGSPDEGMLLAALRELELKPLSDEEAEADMQGALEQLELDRLVEAQERLKEKLRTTGLGDDEKREFGRLAVEIGRLGRVRRRR